MPGKFTQVLLDQVKRASLQPQTPVSLKQFVEFGHRPSPVTILRGNQFVHHELPVRLAHRVVELETLPHGLSDMPSIRRVKDWYTQSFEDLANLPTPDKYGVPLKALQAMKTSDGGTQQKGLKYFNPSTNGKDMPELEAWNADFIKCIEAIKRRHDPTVKTIAEGVLELKQHWARANSPMAKNTSGSPLPLPIAIQSFLDRFYMSRIGIRMLIGQTVTLYRSSKERKEQDDYVGIICTKTNLGKIAWEAAQDARTICQDYYGCWGGPEIKLVGKTDVEFMYVPSHLHHMLFELLKNSLRAVVETYGVDADSWPEIKIVVAEGKEDITIKISDEGGGIPRSGMPLIWTYMYTTAENPLLDTDGGGDFRAPLAGYGYGLPITRLYARYFGGDLRLTSMEGYGTDAYLHLSRLSDSEEPLQ
ncbi:mitochondrial branched-chain alpha-ketoacid dehydrogenase kinase-domain-containing protein [Fimicolochytrium jonesii]|uniref:mitochondrial branched-chain alpha-ketoacid dehydrogenase kinase-domain-containing protein n=1 Tax=Fimicolochytrium jonesii TaxID=1396493 RepID=UPI0022FF1982|nr:mitochondrial branched-chain alpha-ketoacid dehydrogenase kinase-domain-containing protein [Fimicolochytrium jonesii]KAI8818557.1 mitochondrial branched-chain alpha-ketoacid dehydrogenase kinase-domain-containing protein [Fimicolochytrium jonesii]